MVGSAQNKPKYAEFFAGGGMVSAALAETWDCALANDIDPKKCAAYRANFPDHPLIEGDIAQMPLDGLRQPIDLYWASSPCQDFSLAGHGKGLRGARSSVFSKWADILDFASEAGVAPRIVAFENVVGLATRNASRDFHTVLRRIVKAGYRLGALEIDAVRFLPHSRPRLFVIAVRDDVSVPDRLVSQGPGVFHSKRIITSFDSAPKAVKDRWLWWDLPMPVAHGVSVDQFIDLDQRTDWFAAAEVKRLLAMMPPVHKAKVLALKAADVPEICFLYKRGRPDATGQTRQVAEVRFDGVAGCIRTPAGGSSRQVVIVAGQGRVRARLLNPREAVRLMGLGEDYVLPTRFNDAYKIAGDGVAVPAVDYLNRHVFTPLLRANRLEAAA